MQTRHGSLESIILNALWKLEEDGVCTNCVKDVYDYLQTTPDKKAYTTVKTVLDRLYEKKILKRFKHDKKFCYKTLYTVDEAIKESLLLIAKRYSNGDLKKISDVVSSLVS